MNEKLPKFMYSNNDADHVWELGSQRFMLSRSHGGFDNLVT